MKKQSFYKGSAILLGMVIITKIIGIMYKIPLAHILGGTGMGYFSAAYSVFTPVFAVTVSGIPSTMARLTAENYALGRYKNLRRQKRIAHIMFGLISIFATVIIIGLSGVLAENVVKEKSAVYALCAVAPSVIFCTFISVERGYYEGLKNMFPTANSEICETVFKLIFGLGGALSVSKYGMNMFETTGKCFSIACETAQQAEECLLPFIAAGAIAGSSLASGVACMYIFISTKIHGDGITKVMIDKDKVVDKSGFTVKRLMHFAVPIAFVSLITTFTGMIDMLTINPCLRKAISESPECFEYLLTKSLSLDELPNFMYGSYAGIAVLIFGLVPTLTAMFGKSLLPPLTESLTRNDVKSVNSKLTDMMTVVSMTAISSGLGIFVLSDEILNFLFAGRTQEIMAVSQPLSILGIAVIFMGISLPCFTILQTLGKPSQIFLIMAGGGIIKLVLNFVLIKIPSVALSGAAISETVSCFFVCVFSVHMIYKLTNTRCSFAETYFKPFYAGVLCAITAVLIRNFFKNQTFILLNHRIITVFSIFMGGIMYFFTLCLLCEMPKNAYKRLFSKKNQKKT